MFLGLIRPVLDEVVIAKLVVFGGRSEYEPYFASVGWKLERPIEGSRLSWSEEVASLLAIGPVPSPWVPDEDASVLGGEK